MEASLNNNQFEELIKKLNTIIKLLAANLVKDKEQQKDKIIELYKMGLKSPTEISELLGTTPNTVSVALSRARREGEIE